MFSWAKRGNAMSRLLQGLRTSTAGSLARAVCSVAVLLLSVSAACSSDDAALASVAQGCNINSDCNNPLSCTFGKCHKTCDETRDCGTGERCVKLASGNVCQQKDEVECMFTSMCPDPLKCAVDSRCRVACQGNTDCLASQKCVSHVCADTDEVDPATLDIPHSNPNGWGIVTDAGADADSSTGTPDSGMMVPDSGTSHDASAETAPESGAEDGASEAEAEAGGCPMGMGDCDTNPNDCETPLNLITSCGACDVTCNNSHGVVPCTDGKCVITSCTSGFLDCDHKGETGCEAQIATDNLNCGVCGHVCAQTTCETSLCKAVQLDPARTATVNRSAVAPGVLFLNGVNAQPASAFTIYRFPVGGGASDKFAEDTGHPLGDMVVVGTDLWYAVYGTTHTVFKKPVTAVLADVATPVFQPAALPAFMAVRGTALYWITLGGNFADVTIYTRALSAPTDDAGSSIVTGTGGVTSFGVTHDAFYWVGSDGKLYTAPLAGGTGSQVTAALTQQGSRLAADNDYAYYSKITGDALDGVYRIKTGGAPELVGYTGGVQSIQVDATNAYFASGNSAMDIFKAPISGGVAPLKIASKSGLGGLVGQDATFLFTASYNGDAFYRIVK